ncbi:MAG: hypothetical protein ABI947_26430 [Chloroflexota bacterium]
MRDLIAYLCLILFGISIVVEYLAIRRRWLRWPTAGAVGFFPGAMLIFLFALLRGTSTLQSILTGLVLGVLFTILTLSVAIFFQVNEQGAAEQRKVLGKGNPDNKQAYGIEPDKTNYRN